METLQAYLEACILPLYDAFDPAHDRAHALAVIRQSLALAEHYDVDRDMVRAVAAYHDTGLRHGRERHHLFSGAIVRGDARLRDWFDEEQIEVMAQAVEDHRASAEHEPRSIYGRIVAEADRCLDPATVVRRAILYGLAHCPALDREQQLARCRSHLRRKYAEGGYLKLWIPHSGNEQRQEELRRMIGDEERFGELSREIYEAETSR